MGRLIRIDQPNLTDDDWVIPSAMRRYDQRFKPWPNPLFPHDLQIPDHVIQGAQKVLIRRCIEQDCRGDVAIERSYTPSTLTWNLWFQHDSDRNRVWDLLSTLTSTRDTQ